VDVWTLRAALLGQIGRVYLKATFFYWTHTGNIILQIWKLFNSNDCDEYQTMRMIWKCSNEIDTDNWNLNQIAKLYAALFKKLIFVNLLICVICHLGNQHDSIWSLKIK